MSDVLQLLIGGTNLSLSGFVVLCGVSFLGSFIAGALGLGGGVLVLATMVNLLPPTVLLNRLPEKVFRVALKATLTVLVLQLLYTAMRETIR